MVFLFEEYAGGWVFVYIQHTNTAVGRILSELLRMHDGIFLAAAATGSGHKHNIIFEHHEVLDHAETVLDHSRQLCLKTTCLLSRGMLNQLFLNNAISKPFRYRQ